MKIQGSIALVTGAAKGVGRAFCAALLERGAASVEILDICTSEGEELQQHFESKYGKGKALFTHCDVTQKDNLADAVKKAVARHGKLDIMCNNAGIIDEKNWEKMVAINLISVIHGTYIGMEHMNGGTIVNTASMGGLYPMSYTPVYCGSKHGVIGFSRSIAPVALKTKNIRLNCICPAFVDTPLLEQQIRDIPATTMLLGKIGSVTPEKVAEGFIQLVEDDTKYGQVMRVTASRGIGYEEYKTGGF